MSLLLGPADLSRSVNWVRVVIGLGQASSESRARLAGVALAVGAIPTLPTGAPNGGQR
nr:MAG TPA: hypothetical protein [Caudoviricetes sp.]